MGLNYRLLSTRLVRLALPLLFFAFICWIIFDADTGDPNFLIQSSKNIPYGDKWGHFLLYGLLTLLLNLGFRLRRVKVGRFPIFIGALLVSVFSIAEEFTQLAFASRTFDFVDMLADVVGIAFFSLICLQLQKRKAAIKMWVISLVNDLIPDK